MHPTCILCNEIGILCNKIANIYEPFAFLQKFLMLLISPRNKSGRQQLKVWDRLREENDGIKKACERFLGLKLKLTAKQPYDRQDRLTT